MKIPRPFRPTLAGLEPRLLPSSVARRAEFTATGIYTDEGRLALHDTYVAQADGDPGRVVFLGDSITYFWGDPNRPDVGSAAWDARFAPLGARNFGVIGDQTQNLLWRIEHGELNGRPRVAVVLIGINDLIGERTAKSTAGHIGDVVDSIRAVSPKTQVLVVSILPTTNPYLNIRAARVNTLVARSVKGRGVEVEDLSKVFLKPDGSAREGLYGVGGVHPNAAGYRRIARDLIAPVRRLLRSATRVDAVAGRP